MKVLNGTEDLLWQTSFIYIAAIGILLFICFIFVLFIESKKINKYFAAVIILVYVIAMILVGISLDRDNENLNKLFSEEKTFVVDDYRLKSNNAEEFVFFKDSKFDDYEYVIFKDSRDIDGIFKDSKVKYKVNEKYKTVLVVDVENK